ncbi:MAG TPA: phospho-N-acetylmuramoyl-pentapeptide-transferase [Candidatus Ozemobacteraceae bacterium]|nr:phospho-N-acetylmuramoyl-pentapeptide-transferase [Candidatus Ozemobacteraceae bacterium]
MFTGIVSALLIRILFALLTAFFMALIIGPRVIENLKARQIGQVIREEGVQAHKKKAGTPTMGGIIILVPLIVTVLFWCRWNFSVGLVMAVTLFMGGIGLLDDLTKVIKVRSLGLTPRQKLAGHISCGVVVALAMLYWPGLQALLQAPAGTPIAQPLVQARSVTMLPYWGLVDFGWLYLPLVVFVIVGATNAVNLTDGLDGLAAGTAAIALVPFLVVAYLMGSVLISGALGTLHLPGVEELAVLAAALIGGCLGFLWFNGYPAEVFMGDTGSLALGGALASMAVVLRSEAFLAVIGGLFVVEALSVIIQVSYFKWSGGQRIFRMSPIHHHFELCGWPETKVVLRFWMVGLILAVAGLALYLARVV